MSLSVHDPERLERLATDRLDAAQREEALRHIAECEDCRSWLDTYRLFARTLAAESSASGHPSSEQLARYCVEPESLTEPERQRIAEHLIDCRECAHEESLTTSAVRAGRNGSKVLAFIPKAPTRWRPIFQHVAVAAVLLVAILGITLSRIERPTPAAQKIAEDHISGTRVVDAKESITATSTTIESGGDVTFRAGETVVLGDGFSIGDGASFRIEIVKAAADPPSEPPRSPSQSTIDTDKPVIRKS